MTVMKITVFVFLRHHFGFRRNQVILIHQILQSLVSELATRWRFRRKQKGNKDQKKQPSLITRRHQMECKWTRRWYVFMVTPRYVYDQPSVSAVVTFCQQLMFSAKQPMLNIRYLQDMALVLFIICCHQKWSHDVFSLISPVSPICSKPNTNRSADHAVCFPFSFCGFVCSGASDGFLEIRFCFNALILTLTALEAVSQAPLQTDTRHVFHVHLSRQSFQPQSCVVSPLLNK